MKSPILVIEPDPDIRHFLTLVLGHTYHCAVISVDHYQEGVAQLDSQQPQLVVYAAINNCEQVILNALQTEPLLVSVPVLIITHLPPTLWQRCCNTPSQKVSFLPKPFTYQELCQSLGQLSFNKASYKNHH